MSGEELSLVKEAFASNHVAPAGSMLDGFERAFAERTGISHCVALASGTAAMHLAVKSLNLDAGDEVWASTLTFIASIGPAVQERAPPYSWTVTQTNGRWIRICSMKRLRRRHGLEICPRP